MTKKTKKMAREPLDPAAISRIKKERYLLTLSEDNFRDKVVRPLFLRRGFTDGREMCGPQEEGKDTIFVDHNRIGMREIWAIQTKRGNINLSGKTTQNITEIGTQLKTALGTKITMISTKEKIKPDRVMLCTSGKINNTARNWIIDELDDPRILFMDKEDIIPMIDEHFPEFWWGIDADRFPYLRNLRDTLLRSSDTITLAELDIKTETSAPITDDMYVSLYLHRLTTKRVKERGQIYQQPKMEQFPIQDQL